MAKAKAARGGGGSGKKRTGTTTSKRKAAAPAAAAPAATEVHPSEVRQTITAPKFEQLARRILAKQEEVSESSGSMGELIKQASENDHLHKGAFALWKKLHLMGVKKGDSYVDEFLAHFDYMRTLPVQIGRTQYPSLDERAQAAADADLVGRRLAAEKGNVEDDGEGDASEAAADPGTPVGEKDVRPRFAVHQGGGDAGAPANGTTG